MSKKLITEIEIEQRETIIIRQPRQDARPACVECGGEITIRPEEAAAVACVSVRAVFRWIEMRAVHFTETADGRVYVCANSLGLSAREPLSGDAATATRFDNSSFEVN